MHTIVQTVLHKMGNRSKTQVKVMTILLTTILVLCGKVNFTVFISPFTIRRQHVFALLQKTLNITCA